MAFIVFSRKTLLWNPSAKERMHACISPSSACCYTQQDTAKRWCTAVRILPHREFTKCTYLCHHPHFPLPSPQYWSDLEKCTDVHLWMPCYSSAVWNKWNHRAFVIKLNARQYILKILWKTSPIGQYHKKLKQLILLNLRIHSGAGELLCRLGGGRFVKQDLMYPKQT